MRDAMFLSLVLIFGLILGSLSNAFGVTQDVWTAAEFQLGPNDPGVGGFLDQVLAPLRYIFNAVAAFFQIITFQVEGIPPALSAMLLFMPVVTFWLIVRLIRGGG